MAGAAPQIKRSVQRFYTNRLDREIGQFLERSRTVVIPIGSNEQHGLVGLGTDWMCPEIYRR